ncbi:flagellar biosynthesis anti-sigma factor FlgM [Pseudomonas sp. XS1P51]
MSIPDRWSKFAFSIADSDPTTANEASNVKIISANLTNTLPPTDSKVAGTSSQRTELQTLEATFDDEAPVSSISAIADVESASDVDMEKVAALRQAIDSGTFQISSESIYEGLVSSVRETLGSDPE